MMRFMQRESRGTMADFFQRIKMGLYGAVLLALLGAAPELAAKAVPTSLWYELRSVHVDDGPVIDDLTLRADRTVHRPFDGAYTVRVWDADRNTPVCIGSDAGPYRPTSAPLSKSFGWWVANQRPPCADEVVPGNFYVMETCVAVFPESFWLRLLPRAAECQWSNVFQITEAIGG